MFFEKPIDRIIRRRISCRSYLPEVVAKKDQDALLDFMAALPPAPFGSPLRFTLMNASDRQRRELRGLGTYGFIKNPAGFIICALGPGQKNLEDFGYLMEHILLYASQLGLGTCWLGGSFSRSGFSSKIEAGADETLPAVISIGYPGDQPTFMDRMTRRMAGSDNRLPVRDLFFDRRFFNPLAEDAAGDYALPLEMVHIGPSASNKQPWRIIKDGTNWHFYLQRTPGYREDLFARALKVEDVQRVDMGIAMCHFELTCRDRALEGAWEVLPIPIEPPDAGIEYTVTWIGSK